MLLFDIGFHYWKTTLYFCGCVDTNGHTENEKLNDRTTSNLFGEER
ncbi:hypothetical protein FHS70_003824 [Flammeovirga yaeyamensis]|nr:hypothetical protein [Flammeovirga yaeyamensis]